ncbi:MAG: 2-dehydropantoate 2-reductase [Glaciihabitans sp.]|nr:2-dehydropantoate 2-reductase [Glaciihabitans sp.]
MRVGVIGAGAVGGALAAVLARDGHDVQVTARGEHLAAIRSNGLLLRGQWGEYQAKVDAAETLEKAPELVLVATKAQDTVSALADNAGYLRDIPLLVVQNGLDGLSGARRAAPNSDVVGALAMFASSYLSPGAITVTASGPLYVGGHDGEHDVPTRYIAKVLGQVLPVTVLPNFVGAQWTKLVVNQVNALPAITGLSVQEVVANAALLRVLTLSMRETVRIAHKNHVDFEALQGLNGLRLRLLTLLPLPLAEQLPLRLVARMGAVPNPGSTLQSIRRGQATEIDYLNGAVVRAAEAVGLHAPINAALVELVHEVERSRQFISAADVARRVNRP